MRLCESIKNRMVKLLFIATTSLLILIMYYYIKSQQFCYSPKITDEYPPDYQISYKRWSEDNLMQQKDMCGVYAYNAIAKAFWSTSVDESMYFHRLSKLTFGNGILPFVLENFVYRQWLMVKVPKLQHFTDQEKLNILKEELSSGNLIILSVKANGPHYITLLGYNEHEFYVYDSFYNRDPGKQFTDDGNGLLPGNRSLWNEVLLKKWSQWWMYGMYNYYAVVVSKH